MLTIGKVGPRLVDRVRQTLVPRSSDPLDVVQISATPSLSTLGTAVLRTLAGVVGGLVGGSIGAATTTGASVGWQRGVALGRDVVDTGRWKPGLRGLLQAIPRLPPPPPPQTPAQLQEEQAQDKVWTQQIKEFAATQPSPVKAALRQILDNAQQMATVNPHKAHPELQSTIEKIKRTGDWLHAPIANFGTVAEGKLYRGAQPSREGLLWLKSQGIKTIVLLREPGVEETNYPGWSRADYIRDIEALGMKCVEMPIRDRTLPTYQQLEQFMHVVDDEDNQPVYVHCSAGVGRTGVMSDYYLQRHGMSAEDAIRQNELYTMRPETKPEDALQASFLATAPLLQGGPVRTGFTPWASHGPNPADTSSILYQPRQASERDYVRAAAMKTSDAVGAHQVSQHGIDYLVDVEQPQGNLFTHHPALELRQALTHGTFTTIDFLGADAIDSVGGMARALPVSQKLGHAFPSDLNFSGRPMAHDLSPELVARAHALLGTEAPFSVSCQGLHASQLTPALADEIGRRVAGRAQVVDFNLAGGHNPSPAIVRHMWDTHGLRTAVRIDSAVSKAYWQAQQVPWLGLTGDPTLAS